MGIKFQRIEQDRKNEEDRSEERRRQQQSSWRFWPIFLAIVVCVGVGGYLYYYVFSSRMVFPGVIQAPETTVPSPVSGTVTEMLSQEVARVTKGTVLARIKPDPETGSGVQSLLNDLEIRLAQARQQRRNAEAELEDPEDRGLPREFLLKKMSLWQERVRLQGRREALQQELAQHRSRLNRLKRERKRVRRLYRLDAATKEEKQNAEQRFRDAQAEVASARHRLEGVVEEYQMVGRVLDTATTDASSESGKHENNRASAGEAPAPLQDLMGRAQKEYLEEVRGRLEEARAREEKLKTSIEETRRIIRGTRSPQSLEAPDDGTILQRHVDRLDHVREGEPVITMYDREQMYARVYIQPEDRSKLSVGQEVRLYVSGRDTYITGQVMRFHKQLEKLPDRVGVRSLVDRTMLLPVDISLPASEREQLILNETCRAVVSGR